MSGLRHVTVDLPEPPSANRWWRKWNNRMVLSKEARDYKAFVWVKAVGLTGLSKSRFPLFPTEDVRVTLHWVRGRKSGDLDKRIGVALDSLQGILYANDKQVVEIHAHRSDDKANAGLRVTVEAL